MLTLNARVHLLASNGLDVLLELVLNIWNVVLGALLIFRFQLLQRSFQCLVRHCSIVGLAVWICFNCTLPLLLLRVFISQFCRCLLYCLCWWSRPRHCFLLVRLDLGITAFSRRLKGHSTGAQPHSEGRSDALERVQICFRNHEHLFELRFCLIHRFGHLL